MNTTELETAKKIATEVAARGGRAYFVGGCVRDELLGIESKDIDIEVHRIAPEALEEILDGVGTRAEFGKSFGVYSVKGTHIDIAMPRKESATGRGHRDFKIDIDPYIGEENAARRRDFTVGALMKDALTGETLDFFGGLDDLKNGVIRHVNDASFAEDPLRVLRAAQFASRFGFTVAEETIALCRTMPLSALARERVFEELKKALLGSGKPSVFFEVLRSARALSFWFPELEALIGVEQSKKHHAEGDVWVHTMMVLDEAAKRRDGAKNPTALMLAALTHDFGKAICTEMIKGDIHAYGHETEGLPLVRSFLERMTSEKGLISAVLNLVKLHMQPNTKAGHGTSVKSTNKMFWEAKEPYDLILLALSDACGRSVAREFYDTEPFLMERLAVFEEYMARPYVKGSDLVAAGLEPSEDFSEILAYAHKLRLAGIEKESALRQTLSHAQKLKRKSSK
jgi:tRNA nucleotidyltransferase (CCA-adding enzyme)